MDTAANTRVLDFTEVGRPLMEAGKRAGRFATVIHNNYAGSLSHSLLFSLTVGAGEQAMLCVDAHTLAFDWFGVRAYLAVGRDTAFCAAWQFSDSRRSQLDTSPPLCIKCLRPQCDGGPSCRYATVEVRRIPVDQLKKCVLDWLQQELPADARRDRTMP